MISRRDFLAAIGAIGGATLTRSLRAQGAARAPRRLERIGIQLYSVRAEMQRDLDATLARIAAIGYREVEFAGYFGRTPAEIRSIVRAHHLSAPSTHIGYDLLRSGWDKALDDALAAGHAVVTIPWLPEDSRRTVADWRRVADEFNAGAARARARGLGFAYHNHNFEFQRADGTTLLDTLLERTQPDLVSFELDIYWMVRAGEDPAAYIRRYPKRFTMLHAKDAGGPPDHAMVDVGAGTIDFAAILRADAAGPASVRHVFVEHDQPADPFGFARRSFEYLSRLEY